MITAVNLSKSFVGRSGRVVGIEDVTLDIPAGSVYGVLGPAGSGKSTLARLFALEDRPDSGVIRLDGHNTATLDSRRLRDARRSIAVLPGGDSLLARRTVAGNIALPLEQAGVDGPTRRIRVGRVLDLVGLTERAGQLPEALSPGQRRRVAVARALVGEPSVLLADEPTADLDAAGAAGVLAALDRVRGELGATVVVATADSGVVRRVAESVAVLHQGRLTESGHLLSLLQDPTSAAAAALLPSVDTPDPARLAAHRLVAEVVLVGFASVGALLPEAASRFGVDIPVLGGGLTRVGEVPVARFLIGVRAAAGSADRASAALSWLAERGASVGPWSAPVVAAAA